MFVGEASPETRCAIRTHRHRPNPLAACGPSGRSVTEIGIRRCMRQPSVHRKPGVFVESIGCSRSRLSTCSRHWSGRPRIIEGVPGSFHRKHGVPNRGRQVKQDATATDGARQRIDPDSPETRCLLTRGPESSTTPVSHQCFSPFIGNEVCGPLSVVESVTQAI